MLENLGIGRAVRGRKDLRGKKVVFVDDGLNPYRTMCFTIAAKLVKKRERRLRPSRPARAKRRTQKSLSWSLNQNREYNDP